MPGFMRRYLEKMPDFHDRGDESHEGRRGLILPRSIHGMKTYYDIIEYDPVIDSSSMVNSFQLLENQK